MIFLSHIKKEMTTAMVKNNYCRIFFCPVPLQKNN
jgi:hypothetical protein